MAKKARKKSAPSQPHYDKDTVKRAANGDWASIIQRQCGFSPEVFDGAHHVCPTGRCDSDHNAWRFTDMDGDGSLICNKCGRFGDGFKFLEWWFNKKFYEVLVIVAEDLGVPPSTNGFAGKGSKSETSGDPAENLRFIDWSELTVAYWCLSKPPITPAAVLACGGRLAMYRNQWKVIAIPIWGESLKLTKPVGWCMYNSTGWRLPKFPPPDSEAEIEWVKIKCTADSDHGWIGPVEKLELAKTVWKLEGPSDVLAFYTLANIPDDTIAITNAFGAKEKCLPWMARSLTDKIVNVLHDADEPGQEGAVGWEERGKKRPGWLQSISEHAAETYHVKLPYEVEDSSGKDLRDFLSGV
jgi:hypothetical protein